MTDTPLLALWRTVPAPYLRKHPELARDLLALLVEETRPESEDEHRLSEEPERTQGKEEPASVPTADGALSLTVVASIGDSASNDGELLSKLYARLTDPLPLLGNDLDPDRIEASLWLEFPHLGGAIQAVAQDLRLRQRAGVGSVYVRPLLLVGPSGVGKTRFAQRLAGFLGVGCGEVAVAGSSDDRMLRGTARGWRHMQPALPLLVILQSGCANPIIILDELDKAGGNEHSGDIRQTLIPLLEPHTAARWLDECLLAPCDLSRVTWICTANDVSQLPGPLLSRLRVIRCERPTPQQFDQLLESVTADVAHALGIELGALPTLTPAVVQRIRRAFINRGDVRVVKRLVETALGAAAT